VVRGGVELPTFRFLSISDGVVARKRIGGEVAGALLYRLKVDHVYQRRFGDSAAFTTALRSSHWYIITRRPSVRVVGDSVQIQDNMITADFVTRANPADPERVHVRLN
jgi:hypothetical protein